MPRSPEAAGHELVVPGVDEGGGLRLAAVGVPQRGAQRAARVESGAPGGFTGEGTSPPITRVRRASGSGSGTAERSAGGRVPRLLEDADAVRDLGDVTQGT